MSSPSAALLWPSESSFALEGITINSDSGTSLDIDVDENDTENINIAPNNQNLINNNGGGENKRGDVTDNLNLSQPRNNHLAISLYTHMKNRNAISKQIRSKISNTEKRRLKLKKTLFSKNSNGNDNNNSSNQNSPITLTDNEDSVLNTSSGSNGDKNAQISFCQRAKTNNENGINGEDANKNSISSTITDKRKTAAMIENDTNLKEYCSNDISADKNSSETNNTDIGNKLNNAMDIHSEGVKSKSKSLEKETSSLLSPTECVIFTQSKSRLVVTTSSRGKEVRFNGDHKPLRSRVVRPSFQWDAMNTGRL